MASLRRPSSPRPSTACEITRGFPPSQPRASRNLLWVCCRPRCASVRRPLGKRPWRSRVRRREISAVELTRAALARIAAVEPKVGAFLTFADVEAIAAAEAIDRRIAAGQDPGLLGGVPVGVKDIICTAGLRTTAASRILERFVPAYDATVTARLRAAGAGIVRK